MKLVDVGMETCYRQYSSLNLVLIDRFGYLNKKKREQTKVFLKNSTEVNKDLLLANKKFIFEKSNL